MSHNPLSGSPADLLKCSPKLAGTQFLLKKFLNKHKRCNDELDVSIIVVAYDMQRELPRTLQSLSRSYQQGIDGLRYEVIVVDNGSPVPVSETLVSRCGPEFHLIRIDNASQSPAAAINLGAQSAKGKILSLIIDGARMVTPGTLYWAAQAFGLHQRAVVSILGFHLGPEIQRLSSLQGYNQAREDLLLKRIGWPQDGYRLFEIASLAGSSASAWFGPMAESNCLFIAKSVFAELGGFEERFGSPGGGMVNLDFYRRACTTDAVELFYIMGEGCFHQIHGGVTTGGAGKAVEKFEGQHAEYQAIRGVRYRAPPNQPILLGRSRPSATWLIGEGANNIITEHQLTRVRNEHMTAINLDYQW